MTNTHKQLLQLAKQCKTINQLRQIHAHSITSFHSQLLLPQILHTLTIALSSKNSENPAVPKALSYIHYATTLFRHIENPTPHSFNTILRALKSSSYRNLRLIQSLHSLSLKLGFLTDLYVTNSLIHLHSVNNCLGDAYNLFDQSAVRDVVSYNVMIDGFVKNGEVERAWILFEGMPVGRDSVSWGTVISGFVAAGMFKEGVRLFERMVREGGVVPDNVAIVSVLSACANIGDLRCGRGVHDFIKRNGIRLDAYLCTGLVDFYAKCGCIDCAVEVFESTDGRNLFAWNAMIVGLAMHYGKLAMRYFSRMVDAGVQPDGVTFLGVLVACSHAGLVDEAQMIFDQMECVYGVRKELKHYGCMADLLARAGMAREAVKMIDAMPLGGDIYVWGGLLGGCRIHGNIEIAEKAAMRVMELDPNDSGVYSIMASVYANLNRWEDVNKVRKTADTRRVKKNAGCSLIQLDGFTHEFVAWDTLHPQTNEIYVILEAIVKHQNETTYSTFYCS